MSLLKILIGVFCCDRRKYSSLAMAKRFRPEFGYEKRSKSQPRLLFNGNWKKHSDKQDQTLEDRLVAFKTLKGNAINLSTPSIWSFPLKFYLRTRHDLTLIMVIRKSNWDWSCLRNNSQSSGLRLKASKISPNCPIDAADAIAWGNLQNSSSLLKFQGETQSSGWKRSPAPSRLRSF